MRGKYARSLFLSRHIQSCYRSIYGRKVFTAALGNRGNRKQILCQGRGFFSGCKLVTTNYVNMFNSKFTPIFASKSPPNSSTYESKEMESSIHFTYKFTNISSLDFTSICVFDCLIAGYSNPGSKIN